jgi:hypothetical protein
MIIDTDKFKYKPQDEFWLMADNEPACIKIHSISIQYINWIIESVEVFYRCTNSRTYTEQYLDSLCRTKEELCKRVFNV